MNGSSLVEGAAHAPPPVEAWSAPPFGVRRGVLPIYGLAFVLANESSIAVYADGVFQPELDDFLADRLLQDESQISLRYVEPDAEKDASLIELADAIGVSHVTIRNVERGITKPQRTTLQYLIEEFAERGVALDIH